MEEQLSLFAIDNNYEELIKKLKQLDLTNLTPRESMNALFDLKELL